MRTNDKDKHLMLHIVEYCEQIKEAVDKIETLENLKSSNFNKNALSMPLVQLGELAGLLTDELKEKYSHIPWIQVKALRNVLVHSYGKIEWDKVWYTAVNDIPELKKECIKIQRELNHSQSNKFCR